MTAALTSDELELYDRQIRAWGVEAQRQISDSTVVIVSLDRFRCEIAKNVSGLGARLLLCDDTPYQATGSLDFAVPPLAAEQMKECTRAEEMCGRLQAINRLVRVRRLKQNDLSEAFEGSICVLPHDMMSWEKLRHARLLILTHSGPRYGVALMLGDCCPTQFQSQMDELLETAERYISKLPSCAVCDAIVGGFVAHKIRQFVCSPKFVKEVVITDAFDCSTTVIDLRETGE